MLPRIRASRVLACLLGAGALTVGLALPAFAHVTVNPREASQGEYAKLTFRVPNESETASTVKVTVEFPADTPFPSARVKPHQGWTVEASKSKLPKPVQVGEYNLTEAVTSVTWTAKPGNEVKPGEFEEFDVSVGPLPEKESISFPAVQTYSDKSVVKWNEAMRPGAKEEPEHPAPTLTLVKSEGEDHHGSSTSAEKASDQETAAPAAAGERTETTAVDTTARTLGAAGLGVGVLSLIVLLIVAFAVRRNGSTGATK
ncbi:YcnI family copper-binding membrane protein [Flindersiella endophytica]